MFSFIVQCPLFVYEFRVAAVIREGKLKDTFRWKDTTSVAHCEMGPCREGTRNSRNLMKKNK